MQDPKTRSSRALITGLLLYAAALAMVGLWPFDFQTQCNLCTNGATVVPATPGFSFVREGIVRDVEAGPEISRVLSSSAGITIALTARSDGLFQQGPARIVSLSKDASARNFTIGQERARLAFRLRTPATGPNGSKPSTYALSGLWPGAKRLNVATYDGVSFRVYANGHLSGERLLKAGDLSGWAHDFPLVFGNEVTGDRPWRGHLYDLAIYERALTHEEIAALSPDALGEASDGLVYHLGSRCPTHSPRSSADGVYFGTCLVPATYRNAHVWDQLSKRPRQAMDYLVAFALWLPLGAMFARAGHGRALIAMLVLASVLAVGIELGQAALFSRTSSLHDLFAALLGLTVGAMLTRPAASR